MIKVSEQNMNEATDLAKASQSSATYKKILSICKKYGYEVVQAYVDHYEPSGSDFINFSIRHPSDLMKPIVSYVPERFGTGYYTIEMPDKSSKLRIDDFDELLANFNGASKMVHELMKLDLYSLYKRTIKE